MDTDEIVGAIEIYWSEVWLFVVYTLLSSDIDTRKAVAAVETKRTSPCLYANTIGYILPRSLCAPSRRFASYVMKQLRVYKTITYRT
jgi:hypothetical protein